MVIRSVFVDGIAYDGHEVVLVSHERAGKTFIHVRHHALGAEPIQTMHEFPLDLGIDFEQAEQLVMELPEYAEATPEQSLVERMRAMLTAEQLAELGLGE